MNDEADLSAEQSGARPPSRLPRADGDGRRPGGDPGAPCARPQEAVGVSGLPADAGLIGGPADVGLTGGPADAGLIAQPADAGALADPGLGGAPAVIGRMTKRSDYLAANAGRRAPMPGFVLLVRPRDGADDAMRIGITVTKKVGNAVVRNRIKRRFRALAREVLPRHGWRGADHVLIGRLPATDRDWTLLTADLARALVKARTASADAPRPRRRK